MSIGLWHCPAGSLAPPLLWQNGVIRGLWVAYGFGWDFSSLSMLRFVYFPWLFTVGVGVFLKAARLWRFFGLLYSGVYALLQFLPIVPDALVSGRIRGKNHKGCGMDCSGRFFLSQSDVHTGVCTLNNTKMILKKKKKKKIQRQPSSVSSTHPAIEISTPRDYHHFSQLHPPLWVCPRGCSASPLIFSCP